MKELKKIDNLILFTIDKFKIMSVIELSSHLQLDKPILYKSVKLLSKYKLLEHVKGRPKKYFINTNKLKKWGKKLKI